MRWRSAAILLTALCAVPAGARADSFDPISFGVHASTLGYGITLERPLLFDLSARVSTGWLSYTRQQSYDNDPWTSTFQENNVLVAADWRPYAGRWRLSGGILFGGDRINRVATSVNGSYLLNGTAYPVSQAGVVSSTVSFSRPALYLGAGAGTGITKGLTIAFDVGIVLRNGSLTTSATGPLQNNPAFNADLAATTAQFPTQWIQPVAGIGLVFRP